MSTSVLPRLPPLPAVRDLLNLYKLQAVKQLSQNFLLEPRLTTKLVGAPGPINDGCVCEVSLQLFFDAVVPLHRQHLVNRRLLGARNARSVRAPVR